MILSISPVAALAADLWVDANSIGGTCSDSIHRDDVRKNNPWCSLGIAANNVQPGDVVHVREGVYTERQKHENPLA